MNTYLPHIIVVSVLMFGIVLAKLQGRKRSPVEASMIHSRWISKHVYRTDQN